MENVQKVIIPGQGQTSDLDVTLERLRADLQRRQPSDINDILEKIRADLQSVNLSRLNDFMPVTACIFKRKKVVGYQETFIRISFIKEMFEKKIGGSMYIHLLMYDGTCILLNNMSLGEFFGEIDAFARAY